MLSKSAKMRRKRERMWNQNPHCHWCNCLTELPPRVGNPCRVMKKDSMATLDHLRCRLRDDRQEPTRNQEVRIVLSCWKCNNKRNETEMIAAGIDKLREKSGGFPTDRDGLVELVKAQQQVIAKLKNLLASIGCGDFANDPETRIERASHA